MKRRRSIYEKRDYVTVVLAGKTLQIDLYNLKDDALAKRDISGQHEFNGQHFFFFDEANAAAAKVGKRLMTKAELDAISACEHYWDASLMALVFKVPTPKGTTANVPIHAVGFILNGDEFLKDDNIGYYWSSEKSQSSWAWVMIVSDKIFSTDQSSNVLTDVGAVPIDNGLSIRCVKDV